MSSAERVRRHRTTRSAAGVTRHELRARAEDMTAIRRLAEHMANGRISAKQVDYIIDVMLMVNGGPKVESWADYILYAQAGLTGDEPDDPPDERFAEPPRAADFD